MVPDTGFDCGGGEEGDDLFGGDGVAGLAETGCSFELGRERVWYAF